MCIDCVEFNVLYIFYRSKKLLEARISKHLQIVNIGIIFAFFKSHIICFLSLWKLFERNLRFFLEFFSAVSNNFLDFVKIKK